MEESKDPAHRIHGWCACTTSFDNVTVFDRIWHQWITEHPVHREVKFSKFLIQGSFHTYEPYYARRSTVWMVNKDLEERTLYYRTPGNCPSFPSPVSLCHGQDWGSIDYVCSTKSPLARPPSLYDELSPAEYSQSLSQQADLLRMLDEQDIPRANKGAAVQILSGSSLLQSRSVELPYIV